MMLMLLATPPTAKAVNRTETRVKLSNQSTPHTSTRVRDWSVIHQASRPDAMVPRSRCMTPMRLVMSSSTPKMKAGSPANRIGVMSA